MDWSQKSVLVTGGASFIGAHLVDALVERGANVRVVDNLSSGTVGSIRRRLANGSLEFTEADLFESPVAPMAVGAMGMIFYLVAHKGGRGCLDLHEPVCVRP